MAIHKYYLSPCNNKQYSEIMQESGKDNPKGRSEFVCHGNTVLTGHWHEGDENGKTKYQYAELELVDENGNKVTEPDLEIIVGDYKWSEVIKESSGVTFIAPDNQVIVGRLHFGDENGDTQYATAPVTVKRGSNNPTVTVVNLKWSEQIKASKSDFKTDAGYVMVGRRHVGDENGNTLYMSGRLGIDCDETNKELYAYRVNGVETAFKSLPQDGILETFEHIIYFKSIGAEHIQGYTQYQRDGIMYYIFTHHTEGDYGYIMITYGTDCTGEVVIRTPKGYSHPAGIQCVGKYLFVPCEEGGESSVFIYDLHKLDTMGKGKYIENQHIKKIDFNHHRAGCVGITDYVRNGKHYYLMLLGANETYHVYRAEIKEDELKNDFASVDFKELNSFELKGIKIKELQDDGTTKEETRKIDCQGIGLVTDNIDETVYMVAPIMWDSNCDWLYLFKLNIDEDVVSATPILGRHMISHGGLAGFDGIHFRWGAGIRVKPNNRLVVLAAAQGTLPEPDANLDTNFWRF